MAVAGFSAAARRRQYPAAAGTRLEQGAVPRQRSPDHNKSEARLRGDCPRLALACHRLFGLQSIPGYLDNGVPPKYGSGAELVVASVHQNPANKQVWVTDLVGIGDIDRVIIEWRSLLRQTAHAPELDWPRWRELQTLALGMLNETESPTLTSIPPLEYHQTKRVDHRLQLRRH